MALLITAGPLGIATYERNFVWKDDMTLWSDVVAKSPGKARPHNGLGVAYFNRGETREAAKEFVVALKLFPEYPDAVNNLCAAYKANGQLDEAVRECGEAVRLNPELPVAHSNLCGVYQAIGRLDDAVDECREAIRLNPKGFPEVYANLGGAYFGKDLLDDAAQAFGAAIRLDSGLAEAHFGLGAVLARQGRGPEAIEEYRRALALKPTPETILNLAVALDDAGSISEAIPLFQQFLARMREGDRVRAEQVRSRLKQLGASPEPNAR